MNAAISRFRRISIPLCALAIPIELLAQDHHHYKLVDVPTFGGPNFYANFTGHRDFLLSKQGTLIGGADTTLVDPYCFNSSNGDCFVEHSFEWKNGVLTDLGALPGGANSQSFWINARGEVAGMSQTGAIDPLLGIQALKAVVWDAGNIINLGTLEGGYESAAQSINNRGEVTGIALNTVPDPFALSCGNTVVGCQFLGTTQNRAFLWEGGEMRDLGTLGGPDAQGALINDRGQIAGYSYVSFNPTSSGVPQIDPFLWEDGKMVDLGSLGGTFGEPAALNNRGQVVGGMNVQGDLTAHAFLWEKGTLQDLGTFGGTMAFAGDVNEAGEIVGSASTTNDQALVAFVWKKGVMTNLGAVKGDDCSIAKAINSRGQIVGTSYSCVSVGENATLWEKGSAIDLNRFVPPGVDLHLTGDDIYINDRGDIAGTAVRSNGDVRAFLLIPCDENHSDIEGCDYSPVEASSVAASHATETQKKQLTPQEISRIRDLLMNRHRGFMPRTMH